MNSLKRHIMLLLAATVLCGKASGQFLDMSLSPSEWKANSSLRKDTASLAFKPYTFVESSLLPAGMLLASALHYDYLLDENIIKAGYRKAPQYPISDWVQYSPAALMLTLKLCGVQGRNDWVRMLTADAIASAAMIALVNGSKYSIGRLRPDGSTRNSFPSGHTATSFMAATMLHLEYGQTVSPWISTLGYMTATSVGISRVVQDRHWISDVTAGASIGIFSTYLGYSLTDMLYADRRLKRAVRVPELEDPVRWRFSMNTDCSFHTSITASPSSCHPNIEPAYSVGQNADWMFIDNLGVSLAFRLTQLQWTGIDPLVRPDNASFSDLFTVGGGFICSLPVSQRLSFTGRFNAGHTFGHDYCMCLQDGQNTPVSWSIPSGLRLWGNIGASLRTTGHTSLSAYIGKEHFSNVWDTWVFGSSFNLIF